MDYNCSSALQQSVTISTIDISKPRRQNLSIGGSYTTVRIQMRKLRLRNIYLFLRSLYKCHYEECQPHAFKHLSTGCKRELSFTSLRERESSSFVMEELRETRITENMSEEEEDARAEVDIWRYVFGFAEMAVVKCAIELGIAEVMEGHGTPMTLSELSTQLGCEPTPLHRIMRVLVHRRVFKEKFTSNGTRGYALTPLSSRLMKHGKRSMAALVLLESSPVMLAPWHALSACVRGNGPPPFKVAHGEDVWSYATGHPTHSKLISDAMACDAGLAVPAIVEECCDVFDGVGTLVDVGGADGTTLRMLVKAFPWIRGINFDLPHVVSVAPACDGVVHIGGDMFDYVPNTDVAFLKWVLHDWGDEECIDILRKCREAIPEDKGKVIIVEAVIEEEEEHRLKDVRLMLDMVMMAHTNKGKERTAKEWSFVLGQAGFSRHTVKPIRAVQSVIVAFP
ncbi:hypothetical protein HHK36_010386 [Tetracentron sinense]|uniref:Uncharacterized protein n=1 Tax=Tetracentron sinense TaxID=13715 RepID=A0A834ZGV0_TETSI|nr:hypothetical protein HHK36_010386 [Tetracentron sinense]